MTTITKEQAQKIIDAADDVISALAGTNDDIHPEIDALLRTWDDTVQIQDVRELARIALASLEAEPMADLNRFTGRSFELEQQPGADKDPTVYIPPYTSSIAPVLPDGYVLVPIEPTEDMIVNGFESEPHEGFCAQEVWEEYQSMSGCQQAAHRAKLCWAAMIAAAPQQEAKQP